MATASMVDALSTHFPAPTTSILEQGSHSLAQDALHTNIRMIDTLDRKLGFDRYQEGPTRLGWLINMHGTSVTDAQGTTMSAVDYYFLEADGGYFKCTLQYHPYLYLICQPGLGMESEVGEWLKRKFEKLESVELVVKEDLEMSNHLTGQRRTLVKLVFRNTQDLVAVRRELQPILRRNQKNSQLVNAYTETTNDPTVVRELEDVILEMREYDVPYYLRVAIDKGIRVGHWYDVSAEAGVITLVQRDDLVQRPDPVVLAFDIETTKLPLKFPDPAIDMIMMISYMIDGQGYLITNREVVSEDIEDFDYTPSREFPGPFIIFNEPDELGVLRRFFEHIREAKPTVLVTYNGDFFDWPFVDTRARHYGLDLRQETGWYRDVSEEYKSRTCVHMDCLRWVKRDSYLPVGSHGLKAVTTAKLGYNPMEIDPEDMTRFAAEQPQTLAQYSVSDAVATYYLYMKYVHPFIFSLCNIIPLNPDEVLRKGSGTLCETLLMVEAYMAGVAIPNKHVEQTERHYQGHLVETETYVGGHVEALEAGVFRKDIPMRFNVAPEGAQRLLNELDQALRFSIEVEGKHRMEDIENYQEVKDQIAQQLEDLRDNPTRNESPLLYHLDVAAMYPNIILTNRLQPDAIVDDSVCASCDFNLPGKTCDRRMPWLWRGEYFPPKRSEVSMLRNRLQGEMFPPDGRSTNGVQRSFEQLSLNDQAAELRKRVTDYSKKVYHKLREVKVEERQAMICQRENPFYVDTVRNFRDRRYVYKGLLKKEKRKLEDALSNNMDQTAVDLSKKMMVVYDSLQLAHKCILNSFYGYVMRKGARWHSLEMAGVVCLTGSRIIQMARQRVEQLGRPLELDTDGIWCALPGTFPENYSFRLKKGGAFGISYPCTMLNHLVFDKFTNHQYQDLVDAQTHEYRTHSENSIFFEVDGPYRAMILPSSKEADKLLKKRYAVFNDDGSLAELKGFEVKRRGELKLIKIFQSQIFKVFLQGTTLQECYGEVAKVADQWLDILFSKAKGLPDHELFDLITENRSMSKALESYGSMKSTSICTARRLAEFLGDEMVKDKGLACKFVISRQPIDLPVSERAVPVAIFAAEPAIRRQFLRRWLRDSKLEEVDIREILDWSYYLERFGSVIQKLITIPAAMQGVSNPVPRIRHPDWLSKRVAEALNQHKQRHITDMFKKVSKDEYLQKTATEDAQIVRGQEEVPDDMEDFGKPGSIGAQRPKKGVARKFVNKRRKHGNDVNSVAGVVDCLKTLGLAPDALLDYHEWLDHSKKIWRLKRRLKELQQRAIECGDQPAVASQEEGLGQFFTRTHVSLARSVWHVLQWQETEVPGELKAWVLVGGQLNSVRVSVARILYVTSAVPSEEIANSKYFSDARSMVLPRTSHLPETPGHLYKCVMSEDEYLGFQSSWSSFFAHPSIGGVYETQVTALDRALIQLGATVWLNARAKQLGAGRSAQDVVPMDDLDNRRSSLSVPQGIQPWKSRDLDYAIFYHAAATDGRQFFALAMPHLGKGYVWVVSTNQQLQIPNLERLYRETLSPQEGGAFSYPEQIEFSSQAFATSKAAHRAINGALSRCSQEKKRPVVLVCHSPYTLRRLQNTLKAMGEFPTVPMPVHQADRSMPAFDWQRHACRRMMAGLLNCSQWLDECIGLSQYSDIPVGNLPSDAPLFLSDVFFARKLTLAKHILWWSPSSKPDLGGRQDDEFGQGDSEDTLSGLEINTKGSYSTACCEIELKGLAINTILKAPLVNEIEGAFGVFGFTSDSMMVDEEIPAEDAVSTPAKRKRNGDVATDTGLRLWAATGTGGVPTTTFQHLRTLLRGWYQEAHDSQNPFAQMMTDHLYRWLTRPSSCLYDPLLASLVKSLMRKVFLQMKAECQRLGGRMVYANMDKLIISTGKSSIPAAEASVSYLVRAVSEKPLFEHLVLVPLQYWSFLLWMNASNYGGIVNHQEGEPSIEMLWNIKEYLPPVVQNQFELVVAEFIYKLASFHSEKTSQEDEEEDGEEEEVKGRGLFYRKLIGQYFTRKLLESVPQIREACGPAHRSDAAARFPALPGSKLHLEDLQAEGALEFVKYIATVFGLDLPATNFVRVMRRNLLAVLDVGEFSAAAEFRDPCERLVLGRVVCDFCNFCRDMDFCRDADLLPTSQPSGWECLGCGNQYDRLKIEERLVEQLQGLVLAFQMQDLVCGKCRLLKRDNFSVQCTECGGKYQRTMERAVARAQVEVYLDVAGYNKLGMLEDLAKWMLERIK